MKMPASEVWLSMPTRTVIGGLRGGSSGRVPGPVDAAGADCAAGGAVIAVAGGAAAGAIVGAALGPQARATKATTGSTISERNPGSMAASGA